MTSKQEISHASAALQQASGSRISAISFGRVDEGDALIRGWERLEARALLPTLGYAFAAALSRSFLADADIEVFSIWMSNTVAAVLPLCRDRGYFARWRMVGAQEVFEPGDALYANPQAARHMAEALAKQSRPLLFDRIPASSLLVPALQEAMKGKGWVSLRPGQQSPTITLDDRWKNPEACFNTRRRSDFRRATRKAEEFGKVSYEIISPGPGEFDALFDEAIRVELCSWKKGAGSAIASDHIKEEFFRNFFRSACEKQSLRIAFMRIDGQAIAMQLAVEFSERYWLFKIGFDERYGKCSPGTLLMLHTLGYAASRELRAYELLGNVEPWISELWTAEQRDCVRLRTYPWNVRGMFAFFTDVAAWLRERLARGLK